MLRQRHAHYHVEVEANAPQALSIIVSGIQLDKEPDFQLTEIVRTGVNTYGVMWNSVVGFTYRLETSLDLVNWTVRLGDFVATKTTTIAEVTNTVGEGKRFWRATRLEL